MTDDLEAAVRAYADAQAAVVKAERRVTDAKAEVPRARARLRAAIVAATKAGMRQVDIAEKTGYKREQIRRIVRAAGIEPDD